MTHSINTWRTKYFKELTDDLFQYGAGAFTFIDKTPYEGYKGLLKYCNILIPRKDDESKSNLVELCLRCEKTSDFVNLKVWDYEQEGDNLTLNPSIGDNGHTIHCVVKNGILKKV